MEIALTHVEVIKIDAAPATSFSFVSLYSTALPIKDKYNGQKGSDVIKSPRARPPLDRVSVLFWSLY